MVTFVLGLSFFVVVTGSTEFNSSATLVKSGNCSVSLLFIYDCFFPYQLESFADICLISRMNLWTRLSCFKDIDECELGTDICNGNAACTNNIGFYDCSCMDGYTGDGFDCRGIRIFHDWQ